MTSIVISKERYEELLEAEKQASLFKAYRDLYWSPCSAVDFPELSYPNYVKENPKCTLELYKQASQMVHDDVYKDRDD